MAHHIQLDPRAHAGLKLRTERSAELGDAVMSAAAFPHEFRQLQAQYPIVFARKEQSVEIRPFALFGLQEGSNLFLSDKGWDAAYIPIAHRMKPFLIGRAGSDYKVHVDLDSPRIGNEEGEALFLSDGAIAPTLEDVSRLLGEVHEAEQELPKFAAVLADLDLIEPFTLDITLDTGERGRLSGYHTIAEEKLCSLDGETLGRLQAAGYLQPIFMAVASMSQFINLIRRRNAFARGGA